MQYIYPTINGIKANTEIIIKYKNKIQFITCEELNNIINIANINKRHALFTQYEILSNNKQFINIIDITKEYIESDIYNIVLNNGKEIFLTDYCTMNNVSMINLAENNTVTMGYIPENIHNIQYLNLLKLLNQYKDIVYIKDSTQISTLDQYDIINNEHEKLYISLDNEFFLPARLLLSSSLGKLLGYIFKNYDNKVFITNDYNIAKEVKALFKSVFNINTTITKFFDKMFTTKYQITIHNTLIIYILNSLIRNYKFINYIRFANSTFIKKFLIGQIDNFFNCKFISSWDNIKQSIQELSLSTESESYIKSLIDLLSTYNIYGNYNVELYKDNNFLPNNNFSSYSFYLNNNNVNLLQNLIEYKSNKLQRLRLQKSTLFKSQIAMIKQTFYKGYIYNIQTENGYFVANNIVITT